MKHYDAIIVGAGPAGNAAAFSLASAGAQVALIEKQRLPRHKTCGGGMPTVAGELLEFARWRDVSPEAFVEAEARYMRHTWHFAEPVLADMNPNPEEAPINLWMVQRSVFDNALAQRAARAGAELRDGLPVRSIQLDGDGPVRVRAEGPAGDWEATTDVVVGADGVNGMVARTAGLRRDRILAIAIEAEPAHRWGDGHPDLRTDVVHLEYGAVPRGYAWVFPKGDHLNVGAGVFCPKAADGRGDSRVREQLCAAIISYLEALGVPHRRDELVFHGHPLPIWNGLDRIQSRDDRILLAGDSAGLVNPLFGDGILHALKSGQIAAKSILEGDRAGYTTAIAAEFRSNFDAAQKLAKFFYQWPGLCYRHAVVNERATRTAARLLAGEAVFDDVAARVLKRLRKALRSGGGLPSGTRE